MAKFKSSDGWLFAVLVILGKTTSLEDIISTSDILNHEILSLKEINEGLSRLDASGLININNENIEIAIKGQSFLSQNNYNENSITMQLRFSEIFSKKTLPNKVKYVEYFSFEKYTEAYQKYYKEGKELTNDLIKSILNK